MESFFVFKSHTMLTYQGTLFLDNNRVLIQVPVSKEYMLEIESEDSMTEELLQAQAEERLTEFLQFCKKHQIRLSTPESLLFNPSTDEKLDITLSVDAQLERGRFEKILPVVGHAANFTYMISEAFPAYWGLSLSTYKDNDFFQLLSILGAMYTWIYIFLVYTFAGSSAGLAGIGRKLDAILPQKTLDYFIATEVMINFSNEKHVKLVRTEHQANQRAATLESVNWIGAAFLVALNTIIQSIAFYQQVKALAEKATEDDDSTLMLFMAAMIPFLYVISQGVSGSIFQWMFIKQAVQALTSRCYDRDKPVALEALSVVELENKIASAPSEFNP